MTWNTEFEHIPQYEWTSNNQHGDRYKQTGTKTIRVLKLTADKDNASDLQDLILMSHSLSVPVHYDFNKPQTAYIKVMSSEAVLRAKR